MVEFCPVCGDLERIYSHEEATAHYTKHILRLTLRAQGLEVKEPKA